MKQPCVRSMRRTLAALAAGVLFVSGRAWSIVPPMINGIQVLSGGIGEGERGALRAAAAKFTLQIELSEVAKGATHGNWVANARVEITGGGMSRRFWACCRQDGRLGWNAGYPAFPDGSMR